MISDPQAFRPRAADFVQEARRSGDTEAICLALRASAWAERYALEHRRALHLLNEAVRIARHNRLNDVLGQVLVTRGAVLHEIGRLSAARRDFDAAESLVPPDEMAELTIQRATLSDNQGDRTLAAGLYARLLRDPTLTAEVRFKAATNYGVLQGESGRFPEALALFDVASSAAEQVSPLYVALVAENRAWVTVLAGRLADGVAQFDAARAMFEELGVPPGELLKEYSEALMQLRLLPEALDRAREAVVILESHGVELMAAEARLNMARLALLSNRLDEAVADAEAARTSFRRQRRAWGAATATSVALEARLRIGAIEPGDVARAGRAALALEQARMRAYAVNAHLIAGQVAAASGRVAEATSCWTRSQELSRGLPLLVRLMGTLAAALSAQHQGRADRVRSLTRSGLADLAKHRAALPSTELRALASGHGEELGRLGLASRIGKQPAARVLEWMERTRAAALSVVDPEPSEDISDDLGELRSVYTELVAARQESGTEPAGLRARQRRIEQRIRSATWSSRARDARVGAAASAPELRKALDGRVLVEFDVLDGELIAAVLDPRRTRIVRLGALEGVQRDAERLLFYLRYLARPRPAAPAVQTMLANARQAIGRLGEFLIEPLGVDPEAELVVVPVRGLHSLPWTCFHPAPVSLAPSGSMWARSRAMRPSASSQVVLAAGPDLPGAHAEIERLAELHDDPIVIGPPESTMATVAKALDDATLAHLACHCYIRSDNPTFSRLLLSDGFLTVHELDQRADVPHRVILAACESGRDVSYDGNEMLGFVSTLMAKGTAGVLASSVVVPDQELLPLMSGVHTAISDGRTLAAALHTARTSIDRDDPTQFVAWCAFNAFGAA
ncbi:MAG TPA: CHAT domain-containing tetratricopeptide repeat protein [Jiangellaceae bacterium]|nr:CHAT domain-containing tetratricopeptide repeat protein [Jiangellaceae bacterium]